MVTLRKLSRKSKWDYGKYDGETVQSLLNVYPGYILWAYYNLEKISFLDDILDELAKRYKNFERIEKPGKDQEAYDRVAGNRDTFDKWSYERLRSRISYLKINNLPVDPILVSIFRKKKEERLATLGKETLSKADLQAANHGKLSNINPKSMFVRNLKPNKK